MAAATDPKDCKCIEAFQKYVVKELGGKSNLSPSEKNFGKNTTVRKILKEVLGEDATMITYCEASIYPKHQEPKTKKMSAQKFMANVLPELAVEKAKKKKGSSQSEILDGWKTKMVQCLGDTGPTTKDAAVVKRLTDTKGYTGSHKERFDDSGKGKGIEGREDIVDGSGYVDGYKGQGTFDQKKK